MPALADGPAGAAAPPGRPAAAGGAVAPEGCGAGCEVGALERERAPAAAARAASCAACSARSALAQARRGGRRKARPPVILRLGVTVGTMSNLGALPRKGIASEVLHTNTHFTHNVQEACSVPGALAACLQTRQTRCSTVSASSPPAS